MASFIARWIEQRSTAIIVILILATGTMTVPLIIMQPETTASQEPEGAVFDARDLLEQRFSSGVYRSVYLVEAVDGNLLTRAPLLELLENARALRADEEIGPKLHSYRHPDRGTVITGLATIADAVDGMLLERGAEGLAGASEEQLGVAVSRLLDGPGQEAFGLSAGTVRAQVWSSPALVLPVLAEEAAVDAEADGALLGSATKNREHFARRVQQLLRGDERHIRVYGIAIDPGLTSEEQGRAAGPYIGLTIFAVLLVVALSFRSYWTVAVVGFALIALIIWLKGLSNLIGLKSDQILSTIVPIAMISFGVDFAFHSIGRWREESRRHGRPPRAAFTVGFAGVLGALLLAMLSDASAFLSNTTSDIEALVQFGVAAALATVASFVMLGVFSPLALMEIAHRVPEGCRGPVLPLAGSVLASLGAMVAVTLTVFVRPDWGAAASAIYAVTFLFIPLAVAMRRKGEPDAPAPEQDAPTFDLYARIGRVVVALARRRAIVLPLAAVLTVICAVLATRLETRFDVKDFFAPTTDFVVGLEKFDRCVGDRGGEPASIYVEGRLTGAPGMEAIRSFTANLRDLDTDRLARDGEGRIAIEGGLLDPPASASGKSALWESPDGSLQATHLTVRLPGSRALENVREARAALAPHVEELERRLDAIQPDGRAILTGQPIVRLEGIEAITRAFRRSLPVAILLCLGITALFMRSFRYALISCIPILIVVIWLYAFMHVMGFSLNVVTATLGAISIGIGIDFSVHFSMRYREEVERLRSRDEALAVAGAGTGGALLASAASSAIGFSILAFAPMPMFASYGLLTAVMISMATVASLLVLPSLLTLVKVPGGKGDG